MYVSVYTPIIIFGVELEGVFSRGMVDPGGPKAVGIRGMGVGWSGLVRMLVMHGWSFLRMDESMGIRLSTIERSLDFTEAGEHG